MRTTIRLDEHLLRQAKAAAAASGRTFTELVEDALRETLARRKATPRERVELPTWKGGGLMPGVDLDNSAALLDLMEEEDAPSGR
jgi:hypothetical protein